MDRVIKAIEECDCSPERKKSLIACYKNKVRFGCTYMHETEEEIKHFVKLCKEKPEVPWWIYSID